MLLLDLTHTSHTRARTGIQRVARALRQHLGATATPVTRDPFLGGWRALERWEELNLQQSQGGRKRSSQWPAVARWRGRLRRVLGRTPAHLLRGEFDGFIEPEIFGPAVVRDLPGLFQRVRGPRVALFLDAIPLRFPELTPPGTVARFPAYLHELQRFDGVAAISEESRDTLADYWRWLGATNPPPVVAIPLGVDPVVGPRGTVLRGEVSGPLREQRDHSMPSSAGSPRSRAGLRPVVLCVGTLEGRKNHLALLEACAELWTRGRDFELRVIGHVNRETGGAALARLRSLQATGRPLRYDGPATDESIAAAYAECTFTVYPSLAEGFGLPVIESLARGKPCLCSGRGALGEISRHGGCVALDSVTAVDLTAAIERLLQTPAELEALSAAARQRRFKTWADYTRELLAWMQTLPRR